MKIKEGVILSGLQLPMRDCLLFANNIWKDLDQELVITSGLDGTHSAGSLHYYGYALDFRTRYFSDVQKQIAFDDLTDSLGSDYNVIWHTSHIHVEYDKVIR